MASDTVLAELEFDRALEIVAGFAAGPLGAEALRARRPTSDTGWVRSELASAAEVAALLRSDDPFRIEAVPDLSGVLDALQVEGAALDGPSLVATGTALAVVRGTAAELRRVAARAPQTARLLVEPVPPELERAIGKALEPDGSVRDDASPELRAARRRVKDVRARLLAMLESLSAGLSESATEGNVTLRSGRYVIPVRREARGRVGGIVHGESGSGATLFVEPAAAVELGNDLAEAVATEARAVLAVLRELTGALRPHRESIAAGWRMCIAVDDLHARARYAVASGATLPAVEPAPAGLVINHGMHAILRAAKPDAVPFDLTLERDKPTLVISGPNTGGKTVLLKAVGLTAALAQSGIIPPVGAGTRLPVFSRIFVDIGDHQSLAQSLSTFSAHVAVLTEMLRQADEQSLVLVDELGSGTDPAEGAALAAAALVTLTARGALTVVTTHLGQLKQLAADTSGIGNASLAFDGANLAPTYRLVSGLPGRSYALVIARRLGVPEDVLARAEAFRPDYERSLDVLLADVERRRTVLGERESAADAREARLASAMEQLEARESDVTEREQRIRQTEREAERAAREQARAYLLEARRTVEQALALARAAVDEATAKEARRLVEKGIKEEAEALKGLEELKKKGWDVKEVRGASFVGASRDTTSPRVTQPAPGRRTETPAHDARRTASSEIDLRGMTADEAETAVNTALDDAVLGDLAILRIIHGKGTGVLRARVTEILKHDSRVATFALAPAHQGGTGVTVVDLKP